MGRGPGVRTTSASSIQIDFKYRGVRCRERIRLPPTPRNLNYARRLKASIEHEIATRTFDYSRHFPDSPRARMFGGGLCLLDALTRYVDSLGLELEPETLRKYRLEVATIAKALGPDKPLSQLTRGEVRTWVAGLRLSRKRILNILTPLRGALGQAVEDGTLKANPLADFKIRRVGREDTTIDPFTREEVDRLGKTELGHLWKLWAWTGLRSGEVIGLRWGDVEAEGERLQVRRSVRVGREKRPKTTAGKREVAVLSPGRSALASERRRDVVEPVFTNPNTGKRWHEDRGLARAFRKACEAAKVRYRYPYQLRHTFASWALSSGENPLWVAKQMGHRDVQMIFRVYAKWIPSMDPEAGSRMSKSMAA
jgi:integrase